MKKDAFPSRKDAFCYRWFIYLSLQLQQLLALGQPKHLIPLFLFLMIYPIARPKTNRIIPKAIISIINPPFLPCHSALLAQLVLSFQSLFIVLGSADNNNRKYYYSYEATYESRCKATCYNQRTYLVYKISHSKACCQL